MDLSLYSIGNIYTLPTNNCLFKVNNRNNRKRYEICSKLILLLTLNIFTPFPSVSIVNFEQVSVSWEHLQLSRIISMLLLTTVPSNQREFKRIIRFKANNKRIKKVWSLNYIKYSQYTRLREKIIIVTKKTAHWKRNKFSKDSNNKQR